MGVSRLCEILIRGACLSRHQLAKAGVLKDGEFRAVVIEGRHRLLVNGESGPVFIDQAKRRARCSSPAA